MICPWCDSKKTGLVDYSLVDKQPTYYCLDCRKWFFQEEYMEVKE
jgi:hypothetical protein